MRYVSALLIVAVAFAGAVKSQPAQASNYFCGASAFVAPWNAQLDVPLASSQSADYGMYLAVKGKADVAARLTLITDSEAYAVNVPRLGLHEAKGNTDEVSSPFLIRFPKAQRVRYAFVDAVGIDGAAIEDCPSVVESVESETGPDASGDHLGPSPFTLQPKLLQQLPELSCGAVYKPPRMTRELGVETSFFGNTTRHATVRIYLDSDARVVDAEIAESSGVEGIDQLALTDARGSTYEPASFLCTPVVSIEDFDFKYGNH